MRDVEDGARVILLPGAALAASDDATLARALIARDPRAPRVLWQRFAPMVFRMLRRTLGSDTDLDDLAQEVFLCVFEKVRGLREPKALKAFVISVTSLTMRHELRRRWVRRWVRLSGKSDAAEMEVVTPDTDAREALARFYKILDRVNATDRAAFVLRFMEGLELTEVAAALKLSLATTKRRLARVWARVLLLVERDPVLVDYGPKLVQGKPSEERIMRRSSGNEGDGNVGKVGKVGTMNPVNDSHRALTELVGAARTTFGDGLSAGEQAGLVRFEQAVARRTLRSTSRAWVFGFGMVAAGAAAAAVIMFNRPDSMLTFAVVNGSVSDGGYVRAKASGGTELQFSDGLSLALDPGTSTRVTDIDAHGSRVLLESGRAHVRVTHRPAAKWVVDAGPYSVHVVGTEFDVRWSGSEEVLDVQMQRGTVIVRGPLARGGLTMEAGQHLVANVKEGEIFLDATPGAEAANLPRAREESPEPTFAEAPAVPAAPPAAQVGPAHAMRSRTVAVRGVSSTLATPVAGGSWSDLIKQGDFQGVLADAEQRGLARTLETASAADLNALADAARYVRRGDVARRTLLAERDRFPRSGSAREAAFFLGGLAEDEHGVTAAKSALEWYEKYMADSPGGNYAAQALGRKMLLVHKLEGAGAARPIASEYLKLFPHGPYADSAKKLLQD